MKLKSLYFTLSQLVLTNIHLSNNHRFFFGSMKMFLLGKRNFLDIIDLKYTFLELKILLSLITDLSLFRDKLFIYLPTNLMLSDKLLVNSGILYFFGRWYGGLLTNFKKLLPFLFLKKKIQFSTNIDYLYFMPGLIFLFNPSANLDLLNEGNNLDLPVSGTLDGSSLLKKKVNYIVVGNTLSVNSIYWFLLLFKEAFVLGQNIERDKTLDLI